MLRRDNVDIELKNFYPNAEGDAKLKQYTRWLDERHIKYSMVRNPIWSSHPTAINMRNEDALIFCLVFEV
jgi:hypothetical protein